MKTNTFTSEIKTLAKEIKDLEKLLLQKQQDLRSLKEKEKAVVGAQHNGTTIYKRKGSYLIVREDGKGITFPIYKNSYNERNVYLHDGKKKTNTVLLEASRLGHLQLATWFKDLKLD